MQKIQSITYQTKTGDLTVSYDRPEWIVNDNGTEHRFPNVPAWMAYARQNHGWPLTVKGS